jgi:hypothetical protein
MFRPASEPRPLPFIALLCCTFNIIASLLVLVGWGTNSQGLVQPMMGASPVVPLTAICVLIATIGLSYLTAAKATGRLDFLATSRKWSLASAIVIMITLCEYLFGSSIGLESVLLKSRVAALVSDVPYPGRLAPQTALSLLVFSLGIYWMGQKSLHAMRDGGIVIAVGMVIPGFALVGHFINFPAFHTLAGLSVMSMAKPTAMLLLILGAGALSLSDPHPRREPHRKVGE